MLKINDHIITTDLLYPIHYNTSYEKEYLIDTGTMTTTVKRNDITIDKQYYRNIKINQIIND